MGDVLGRDSSSDSTFPCVRLWLDSELDGDSSF